MQVLFDFDENQSAQKALEIIAKQLGGQVISSGKVEKHEGSRMFVKIEMPRDTEVDGILIRFCKRSMNYLESLGLNPSISS